MNLSKVLAGLAASVALCATITAPASAQQINFAGLTAVGDTFFRYSPLEGATGGLDVGGVNQFAFASDILPPGISSELASVTFTGLDNIGVLTPGGAGEQQQTLTGGTFSILDADAAGRPVGTVLLTGNFASASLFGVPGSSTGNLRTVLNNVTYTGGEFFLSSGLLNPGGFSLGLSGIDPLLTVAGGRFIGFQSGGGGTFSATVPAAVPEPGVVAFAAVNGLGVLGLMVRARRRGKLSA